MFDAGLNTFSKKNIIILTTYGDYMVKIAMPFTSKIVEIYEYFRILHEKYGFMAYELNKIEWSMI